MEPRLKELELIYSGPGRQFDGYQARESDNALR